MQKKPSAKALPQGLEVGPRNGPYLLVTIVGAILGLGDWHGGLHLLEEGQGVEDGGAQHHLHPRSLLSWKTTAQAPLEPHGKEHAQRGGVFPNIYCSARPLKL